MLYVLCVRGIFVYLSRVCKLDYNDKDIPRAPLRCGNVK